jgi:hypothetical protein
MAKNGSVYIAGEFAKKSHRNKVNQEILKLEELVKETETVIYQLSSVFPFQLFPDKIIIDKSKVTIVRKEIFFKRVFPILIENIKTVKVSRGLLFAAMEFEITGYEENPRPVTFFWPGEATKAKQYIFGLIQAKKGGVDLAKLTTVQIKKRLEEIGKAEEEVESLF